MAMKMPARREVTAMAKRDPRPHDLEVEVVFTLVLFGFSAFQPFIHISPRTIEEECVCVLYKFLVEHFLFEVLTKNLNWVVEFLGNFVGVGYIKRAYCVKLSTLAIWVILIYKSICLIFNFDSINYIKLPIIFYQSLFLFCVAHSTFSFHFPCCSFGVCHLFLAGLLNIQRQLRECQPMQQAKN